MACKKTNKIEETLNSEQFKIYGHELVSKVKELVKK